MKKTYSEKLKDPRWQKKRLEVLEAAGWKCHSCGCADNELHVHHPYYEKGKAPWEYENLVALCAECHESTGDAIKRASVILSVMGHDQAIRLVRFLEMAFFALKARGSYVGADTILREVWDEYRSSEVERRLQTVLGEKCPDLSAVDMKSTIQIMEKVW